MYTIIFHHSQKIENISLIFPPNTHAHRLYTTKASTMSTGRIYVVDEQYGILRKSARLNPTSIPVQLLTPHVLYSLNLVM